MAGRGNKVLKNSQDDKAIIERLKSDLETLNQNLAIYKNDIARAINELKSRFGVKTIQDATKAIDDLTEEIKLLETERNNIIKEVEVKMSKYNTEAMNGQREYNKSS